MKLKLYDNKIKLILLTIYMSIVFCSDAYIHLFRFSASVKIIAFVLLSFAALFVSSFLLRFLSKWNIRKDNYEYSHKEKTKYILLFFFVSLFILLFYYIAFYPACFTNDTEQQYVQALTNKYNDWHPVIQTLLAIKLPLLITGGWLGSIGLLQIVFFSIAITYLSYTVLCLAGKKIAIITYFLVILNPQTTKLLFPLKDMSFAICIMLLMSICANIFYSKGKWIDKKINMAMLIVILSVATLLRHNSVLFIIPLIIALVIVIPPKKALTVILCFVAIIGCVKGPLYSALNVEKPDLRTTETVGLPLSVISTSVKHAPKSLDKDILEFAYKVAPEEYYESYIDDVGFNSIKWKEQTNLYVIEEYDAKEILNMTLRCFEETPKYALLGFIKTTNPVYSVSDLYNYSDLPRQYQGEISGFKGVAAMQDFIYNYASIVLAAFMFVFLLCGVLHMFLLSGILAKIELKVIEDKKRLLFILPMFMYNYGTMFLLTGASDASRFFFYSFCISPILIVFIFKKRSVTDLESVRFKD